MKKITLAISDDLERLLLQFLHTDHRGTHNPIYLVQTQEKTIIDDGGNAGHEKYYCKDSGGIYDTPEELIKENTSLNQELVKSFDELVYEEFNDTDIYNLEDYFKAYEVDVRVVSEVLSYRTIAYFFSEEEARRYIKYQSHNLTNPRTYAAGPGYANDGDWDPFYNLLLRVAKKCEEATPEKADPEQDVKKARDAVKINIERMKKRAGEIINSQ